ncbi:MAG: hypothetical protein ACYTG5_13365 [Planctomycetota bacterium]|jgi:hypothetical protein
MRCLHVFLFCLVPLLPAQSKLDEQEQDYKQAVSKWLDSDHEDVDLMARASESILATGKKGLRYLGELDAALDSDADRFRQLALDALTSAVAIGYLEKEQKRGMVYAGQFDPLDELQPKVGELFIRLVIDTPDWFPETMRPMVIPALRDLYPKGPDRDSIRAMRRIAEDEDFEAQQLRLTMINALAQWGERDLVEDQIRELREKAGDLSNDEELLYLRQLGRLHYDLREYETAAEIWLGYLRGMEGMELDPLPFDYYNTACTLSMTGQLEEAFAELERCAKLLQSPHLDRSARIKKNLWEEDPELRAIRPTRRFQELVKSIFPEDSESPKSDGKRGG